MRTSANGRLSAALLVVLAVVLAPLSVGAQPPAAMAPEPADLGPVNAPPMDQWLEPGYAKRLALPEERAEVDLSKAKSLFKPGYMQQATLAGSDKNKAKLQRQPADDAPLVLTIMDRPSRDWAVHVMAVSNAKVQKDDRVLVRLKMRAVESQLDESGQGQALLFIKPLGNDRASVSFPLAAGREWQQFSLPFVMRGGGQLEVHLVSGYGQQTLAFDDVQVLNFGPDQDLETLPRTLITWPGIEPDAAWRQAAQERIEKHRMAPLAVVVTDAAGNPVPDAQVQVRMTRHAFGFGTAVDSWSLQGAGREPEAAALYRGATTTLFNVAVLENAMKWIALEGDWGSGWTRERALSLAAWLEAQGLWFRGHTLVWPSESSTPAAYRGLLKPQHARILDELVDTHVRQMVIDFAPVVDEWDVLNEAATFDIYTKILGIEAVAEWFKIAKEHDPSALLVINDHRILADGGTNTAQHQRLHKLVEDLLAAGAPVEAIGMQGHFGGQLTSPQRLVEVMDDFARHGLPLRVTEMDVQIEDPIVQALYLRDAMTALFSHPANEQIVLWGYWAGAHWRPSAALWEKDWTIKPAGKVWMDLVHHQWRTDETGKTDATGRFATRAFLGEYELTVTHDGRSVTSTTTLDRDGHTMQMRLPAE